MCPLLGHVFGELYEVLSILQRQKWQDPAVAVHALFVLSQAHLQAAALPQIAHIGRIVLDSCGNGARLEPREVYKWSFPWSLFVLQWWLIFHNSTVWEAPTIEGAAAVIFKPQICQDLTVFCCTKFTDTFQIYTLDLSALKQLVSG